MGTNNGSRRVLLQDIAKATGFTVNTVSRALKNKTDISRATCEQIQKVANEMGYVRNNIASSLRSGQSRTISVIVGEVSNPFYAIMIDTIHDIAETIGYTVLVLCSRDNEEQEQKAIITSIERQVDGVLLFPSNYAASSILLMQRAHIPFVLVSRYTPDPDYDCVVCDEEGGGYLAGKHLIEAGHRKLAFVYSTEVLFSSEQRVRGLKRAASEAHIPPEDVRIYQVTEEEEAVRQLRAWKSEGLTGLFLFCDMEAWKMTTLLETCGMVEDFDMVGFDNIQKVIRFPSNLCTIDGSMRVLVKAAMEILQRRIHGEESLPGTRVFPVHLVCRGSCKTAPVHP